jgi:hypothetical protein
MTIQKFRAAATTIGCLAVALCSTAPARAGLINPTSTVNPFFDFVDPTSGPLAGPSTVFSTGALGPFSLAAPITPPVHTTEPFNISADAGFFFTDSTVTIYNNASNVPFCESSGNSGSSCADPYNTFDFKFTNEDITGVAVASNSSPDFAPATFDGHLGLVLVSPNEFTVDVTGDNPAFLSSLIIDVTTGTQTLPTTPLPSTLPLLTSGLSAFGLLCWRTKRKAAAIAA